MAVMEERKLTQCGVTMHLQKTFVISLPRPSEERIDDLRGRYGLAKLTYDSDKDLIGREGRITEDDEHFLLREIGLLWNKEKVAATCLGQTTEGVIRIIEDIITFAFDLNIRTFREAVVYVGYSTTTKVQFDGPLAGIFGPALNGVFSKWSDLSTKSIAAPFSLQRWPPETSAMVHATEEYWEKYFGEGTPSRGFVVPADLDFMVYLPTRFFRMLKYRFRLNTETFEDYLEHRYFAVSELPHGAHMNLLDELNESLQATTGENAE